MTNLTENQRDELEFRFLSRVDDTLLIELSETVGIRTNPDELEAAAKCPCADCETDTADLGEWYMLKPEIWQAAGMTKGFLCIGCVEQRLERKLTPTDFPDAPVNRPSKSDRLLNRLGYTRSVR